MTTVVEPPKITADKVINELIRTRYQRTMVIPRFTPRQWWECDMFELTRTGYFREYEVKLSRGDFFADAKKENVFYPKDWDWRRLDRPDPSNKHALIAAGHARAPVQFYFVTPKGMLKENELPSWAGHIEIRFFDTGEQQQMSLCQTKKAPRLHRLKADASVHNQIRDCCYYRMHSLLGSYSK